MRLYLVFTALVLAALLVGCATKSAPSVPPPTQPAVQPEPAPVASDDKNLSTADDDFAAIDDASSTIQ